MAYYKKLKLVLILTVCFLFFLNCKCLAFSFIDKNGEIYTTDGNPQYSGSNYVLVTYYDGYYYFFAPNDPSGNATCYWYVNNDGFLWNSYKSSIDSSYSLYSARIIDGGHSAWESLGFVSIPTPSDNLFYENITYNKSPIYDSENGLLITKPLMNLEGLNNMELSINNLQLNTPIFGFWKVFNICLIVVSVFVLFVFGYYLIKIILKGVKKCV